MDFSSKGEKFTNFSSMQPHKRRGTARSGSGDENERTRRIPVSSWLLTAVSRHNKNDPNIGKQGHWWKGRRWWNRESVHTSTQSSSPPTTTNEGKEGDRFLHPLDVFEQVHRDKLAHTIDTHRSSMVPSRSRSRSVSLWKVVQPAVGSVWLNIECKVTYTLQLFQLVPIESKNYFYDFQFSSIDSKKIFFLQIFRNFGFANFVIF